MHQSAARNLPAGGRILYDCALKFKDEKGLRDYVEEPDELLCRCFVKRKYSLIFWDLQQRVCLCHLSDSQCGSCNAILNNNSAQLQENDVTGAHGR